MLIEVTNAFGDAGKAVLAAYSQALLEGFTPIEAKKLILSSVKNISPRTIYLYLPDEAKNKDMQRLRLGKKLPLQSCNGTPSEKVHESPEHPDLSSDEHSISTINIESAENDNALTVEPPPDILSFELSIPFGALREHMAEEFKVHQGTEPVSIIGGINKTTKEVVSYRLKKSFKGVHDHS